MRNFTLNLLIFTALSWLAWHQEAPAQTTQSYEPAMRLIDLPDGSAELDALVVTYVNDDGVSIALYSAVHVADRVYYTQLNDEFATYDAVMYEMILPRGTRPPPPGSFSDSGLSMMQRAMKNVLALDFQLDVIDYTKRNFMHADLYAEDFKLLMEERNESMLRLMMRAAMHDMSGRTSEINTFTILAALASPDRAGALKRMLAKQFVHIDDLSEIIDGPDGSVLLSERNNAAVEKTLKAVDSGKRKLAVFYGAAHIRGIGELLEENGYRRESSRWITAWTIDPPQATTQPTTRSATQPAAAAH